MTTDTEQKPLLGRCKECDYTLFATEESVQDAKTLSEIKLSGIVYRVPGHGGHPTYLARCNQRHKVFSLKRIKGTYSKDHKCDVRCLNAKGNECTCSCGGANHGRGHAVTVHEASEAPTDPKRFLGEEGKHIRGTAKLQSKRSIKDSTLYVFISLDGTAIIKWYAPSYADPDFEVGQEVSFRARVKRHEDHETYGKATVVTYLEEV